MQKFNLKLIFIFSMCFFSLKAKEPSQMLTIPLKLINTTFEKYPTSGNSKHIIEEFPVKTIFGTRMIRRVVEELNDISGNISKAKNSLFVAPIKIGGQDFNVVLDTGSVNLWVPKVGSKDQTNLTHHYDPSKSSSSSSTSETFEITYGTGSTKGNYYSDYVNFITNSTYNLLFGAATETVFDVEGADGIMGLAKNYEKYMYSAIWTLNSKGYIPQKSFSFKYLSGDNVEMYIGGEHEDFNDKNHTATCQLLHKSVYDNLLWTCKLYNFGFLNSDFSKNTTVSCGYNFLFDTGSNVMRLPKQTLNSILNQPYFFNCKKSSEGSTDYLICPKDNLPNIYIEVGDHYFIIPAEEMFDTIKGNENYKKLRVQFMDVQISLIGQPFFRLFHTKFDYENKILKFHTLNDKTMIHSYAKPNDDEATHFDPDGIVTNWLNENTIKIIAAVAIVIAVIFIIVIIVKCGKKSCCKKDKQPLINS